MFKGGQTGFRPWFSAEESEQGIWRVNLSAFVELLRNRSR
jgi:hypothetical protein